MVSNFAQLAQIVVAYLTMQVCIDVTFNILDEEGTTKIIIDFVALLIVAEIDERTAEFLLYFSSAVNEFDIKAKIVTATDRFKERANVKSKCGKTSR